MTPSLEQQRYLSLSKVSITEEDTNVKFSSPTQEDQGFKSLLCCSCYLVGRDWCFWDNRLVAESCDIGTGTQAALVSSMYSPARRQVGLLFLSGKC